MILVLHREFASLRFERACPLKPLSHIVHAVGESAVAVPVALSQTHRSNNAQ